MESIITLSLFDGMSCGQLALRRAGIPIKKYFASEIDKHAIKVTMANFPETEQIGSVTDVKVTHEGIFVKGVLISSEIPDLLIGGSPCQGFSFAGKQLNFDDPRSALFFEFVRIYKEIKAVKPEAKFLLENVKMKKEFMKVITDIMGVEPVEINSALVSAQNRKRLYWTNINGGVILQPEDRGVFLKDIVHEFEIGRPLSEKELGYMLRNSGEWSPSSNNRFETYLNYPDKKHHCLTANLNKGVPYNATFEEIEKYIVPYDKTLEIFKKEVEKGKIKSFKKDSGSEVYYIHGSEVLIYDAKGAAVRNQITKEGTQEFLNTRADDKSNCVVSGFNNKLNLLYLFGCITPDRVEKRQNGQRFSDGQKFYTLTAQDKHGILVEGYIRKLTPVECERLQTVPDGYTAATSDSQRYKMLGNGWTVDVISHIFSLMQNPENYSPVINTEYVVDEEILEETVWDDDFNW